MNFFIVLGKSGHPLHNRVFSRSQIMTLAKKGEVNAIPVQMPWDCVDYEPNAGGKGSSPYPPSIGTRTIRVAADPVLELETKRFNLWLAWEQFAESDEA